MFLSVCNVTRSRHVFGPCSLYSELLWSHLDNYLFSPVAAALDDNTLLSHAFDFKLLWYTVLNVHCQKEIL